MKAFVFVSCLLAVASAGYLGPVGYSTGVLGHDGHPVDTAEVSHAKAAHFAAHAEANARIASVAPQGYAQAAPNHYNAPAQYNAPAYTPSHYSAPTQYNGPQHIPVIGPLGVPLETPEVVAAKAANAAAHAKLGGASGYAAPAAHGNYGYSAPVAQPSYGYSAAPVAQHYAAPANVLGHDGHPVDTAEVAHAKAAHFAAVAEATARAGPVHRYRRGVVGAYPYAYASPLVHAYPQHVPVVAANGVPLDTPEVAAAKINHAAAHVEAKARNGDYAVVAPVAYSGLAHSVLATPYVAHTYAAQHIPTIGPNGVPLDTPEVAAGKVANAVAHAEAKARNGDYAIVAPVAYSGVYTTPYVAHTYAAQHIPAIGPNGVPLDTPEVAAGKIANAVAHAEAKARNGDLVYHY